MRLARTGWIESQHLPVHVGWYEVKDNDGPLYVNDSWKTRKIVKRYWNGVNWKWRNPEEGMHDASFDGAWRGVKQS